MYCCFKRAPFGASMLNLTLAELSVAVYSRTGIETKPKLKVREAIERAAMSNPPKAASTAAPEILVLFGLVCYLPPSSPYRRRCQLAWLRLPRQGHYLCPSNVGTLGKSRDLLARLDSSYVLATIGRT